MTLPCHPHSFLRTLSFFSPRDGKVLRKWVSRFDIYPYLEQVGP